MGIALIRPGERIDGKEELYAKLSGALLFSSGIIFLIVNTVAEAMYPGYSVRTDALSDLGALGAPTMILWNAQLFLVGVFGLLGIYLLFFKSNWAAPISKRNPTATLFILPAIGSIIVSLIPENFVRLIHGLGALLNFAFGGISAVYAYKLTSSPFRYFSLLLGLVSFAGDGLLAFGSVFGFGLVERMVVYPLVIWNVAFGSYLMTLSA